MEPNLPNQSSHTNPPAPQRHGLRAAFIIAGSLTAVLVGAAWASLRQARKPPADD